MECSLSLCREDLKKEQVRQGKALAPAKGGLSSVGELAMARTRWRWRGRGGDGVRMVQTRGSCNARRDDTTPGPPDRVVDAPLTAPVV